jgi:hypothetical protein
MSPPQHSSCSIAGDCAPLAVTETRVTNLEEKTEDLENRMRTMEKYQQQNNGQDKGRKGLSSNIIGLVTLTFVMIQTISMIVSVISGKK